MPVELRGYQENAVAALLNAGCGVVKAPAGSGKCLIGAEAVRRWLGGDLTARVLWLANTIEQCQQARSALASVGVPDASVEVACYQSGKRAEDYDLFVGDEIHHIASAEFRKCVEGFRGPKFGLSATPDRADDLAPDTFKLIGPIVFEVDRKSLIVDGHLAEAHVYFHAPNSDNEYKDPIEVVAKEGAEKMESAVAYNAGIMANKPIKFVSRMIGKMDEAEELADASGVGTTSSVSALLASLSVDANTGVGEKMDTVRGWLKDAARAELLSRARWHGCQQLGIFGNGPRNKKIIELALANPNDSLLILVGSIEHGNLLQAHIPGSLVLHSKMGAKKRSAAVQAIRDGTLKCAISTSLFDEGADAPRLNVLILAAAGRSAGKAEQRTGRVLRTFFEKTHGTIHDFWDRQHPMLLAQSKARAKVYAGLDYEFCENDLTPDVLKAIGITSHAALPVGQTVRQKKYSMRTAKQLVEEAQDDELINAPEGDSENILGKFGCGLHQPERSLPASAEMGTNLKTSPDRVASPVTAAPHSMEGSTPGQGNLTTGCINPATETPNDTPPTPEHRVPEGPAPGGSDAADIGVSGLAHGDRVHARLSPSKLKYKAICSGFENDESSDKSAANRGSLGHECVEKENLDLAGDDAYLRIAAKQCIDYKHSIYATARQYAKEQGVELIIVQESKLRYFDQWGFCDELLVAGNKAWLIDWKFAFNFYPADIPQFHAYSVGTWDQYLNVQDIEVHVGHPFLDKVDVETFNRVRDYDRFRLSIKATMAKVELNRPEDYRVTEQCVWCGFASKCAKLANLGLEIGMRYAPELTLPVGSVHGSEVTDPAHMAALQRLKPIVEKAVEGWGKAGLAMHDKTPLPGFRIVTREGKRIVSDPAVAFTILKENFNPSMTPEQFMRECSIPITVLDELVSATAPTGKKKGATANLTALLEDADAIKHGAASRFLKAEKSIESK